jgi:hypothetical protein
MLRQGFGLDRTGFHLSHAASTAASTTTSSAAPALLLDRGIHRLLAGPPRSVLLLFRPFLKTLSFLIFDLLQPLLFRPLLVHLGHFLLLPVQGNSLLSLLTPGLGSLFVCL